MARRVKDQNLESRDARLKLKTRGKPYWRAIGRGLHVGYRKGKTGGMWVVRRYLGQQNYQMHTIAQADDMLDAMALRFSTSGRRKRPHAICARSQHRRLAATPSPTPPLFTLRASKARPLTMMLASDLMPTCCPPSATGR